MANQMDKKIQRKHLAEEYEKNEDCEGRKNRSTKYNLVAKDNCITKRSNT
jgi:hypothetical protein